MPNPLAAGEADKIAAAVDALTGNGNTTIDAFFGFFLQDAGNRAQNWFSDTVGSGAAFINSPTYVSDKGVSFNGTNQYFNTDISPNSLGNYSQNDGHIETYCYENRGAALAWIFGCNDTGNVGRTGSFQNPPGGAGVRVNSGSSTSTAIYTSFGDNERYGAKRGASNSQDIFRGGVSIANS